MSLYEKRVLHSMEYNFDSSTVNVAWKDLILKDGFIVSETVHRGAFPVDSDGQILSDVAGLNGRTIAQIVGEDEAKRSAFVQEANAAALDAGTQLVEARQLVEQLRQQIGSLSDQTQSLTGENTALRQQMETLTAANAELQTTLSQNNTNDDTLATTAE